MSDAAPIAPVASPVVPPEAPTAPTDTPPKADAKPPEPKPEPRRYKVKIDGQESEVTDEELVRGYQRASAASKRLEEVAKARKELEERTSRLKADPWAFLKEGGLDPDQLAIQRVQALMEQESMTQEQRRIAALEAEKAQAEAKAKRYEEEQAKATQTAEMQRAAAQLNKVIPEAAEKVGLPRTPQAGRMVVEQMLAMARAGVDPDPVDAAEAVKERLDGFVRETMGAMDDAKLVALLGPEMVRRLATYAAGQARSTLPGAQVRPLNQPPKPKAPPRPMTVDEWREKYGG